MKTLNFVNAVIIINNIVSPYSVSQKNRKGNFFVVIYDRKSLRLQQYDYSNEGMYFVTISVKYGNRCLGQAIDGDIILNHFGQIVADHWLSLPDYYPNCRIDEFIVMPDHFHGILEICDENASKGGSGEPPVRAPVLRRPSKDISSIIRAFKLFTAKRINALNPSIPFQWHRSYHDHIIRNEKSLINIRQYIRNNPIVWPKDDLLH